VQSASRSAPSSSCSRKLVWMLNEITKAQLLVLQLGA